MLRRAGVRAVLEARSALLTEASRNRGVFSPQFPLRFCADASPSNHGRDLAAAGARQERARAAFDRAKAHGSDFMGYVREYGLVFVGTYAGIYVTTLGSMWGIVGREMHKASERERAVAEGREPDVGEPLFDPLGVVRTASDFLREHGLGHFAPDPAFVDRLGSEHRLYASFAVAWILSKFTEPARAVLAFAVTPRVARILGRIPSKR
mmetsp:Transcript_13161/g.43404  ORF Transcript_13161/g.43404 Transcript_13161/m.43404 type:complete len:208 (+) Transcript_13161:29-652(+)